MNLPSVITHNYEIKLVSVVMASLFWLYVMAESDVETRVQVPVIYSGLANGLTLAGKPPETLDVEMHGSRLAVLMLWPKPPCAVLDLSGVNEGSVSFVNLESAVQKAKRVRITRVYPGRIDISVTNHTRR